MRTSQHPPQSICILRLSALGDATHVLPVIRGIQEHWPGTQVSWIIGAAEHSLVQSVENVEFIVYQKHGGWAAIRKLRRALRGRQFEVLMHMQVSARANLLSRLVDAPLRLGWDRERSREFHRCFINQAVAEVPFQHQVNGFLEFPRALGLTIERPRWDLPVSDAALQWAQQQLDPQRRTLIISPCSQHPLRNWPARHFATVADFASSELGMQVVLFGGQSEAEREAGIAIELSARCAVLNLIGRDTLEQAKALLQQADLLISPDSGPVHIASALGTPVLGLYAATWSRRSGPYNSLDLCVDHFDQAARKYCRSEPGDLRWGTRIEIPGVMDLIRPGEVIDAMRRWWENSAAAIPP